MIRNTYYLLIGGLILMCLLVIVTSENFHSVFNFYAVTSNSMSPVIAPGSIVIIRNEQTYLTGEIISYDHPNSGNNQNLQTTTHRIIHILDTTRGKAYVTKGDANLSSDQAIVFPEMIKGKVKVVIPAIGYLVLFLNQPLAKIWFILLPTVVIVLIELYKVGLGLSGKEFNFRH